MSKTLSHSNEVGGTTVMDDGTTVHWNESGSETVIIKDEQTTVVPPYGHHPIMDTPEIAEMNTTEHRAMTEAEEQEWEKQMYSR